MGETNLRSAWRRRGVAVWFWGMTTSLSLHLVAAQVQSSRSTAKKPATTRTIAYTNKKYGFRFDLPESWKGYSIVMGTWGGAAALGPDSSKWPKEEGPEITIRHPLWTKANPRQDIPIMVLTHRQWALNERQELIVSAAPFGPGEIGRNSRYVFALPPRYDYAFPTGYEEVEKSCRANLCTRSE